MGGFGSGRDSYATTPTVEECLHLDVNQLKDAIEARYEGPVWWGSREDGDSIVIRVNDEGDAMAVGYVATRANGEEQEVRSHVQIERTECHFGGLRPWFRCPRCHDRVGKLYKPPRGLHFRCRGCHDLAYTSSRESGDEKKKAKRRYRKAQRKLDVEPTHPNSLEGGIPERPKGMHKDTYRELLVELSAAREAYHEAMMDELRGIAATAGIDMPTGRG